MSGLAGAVVRTGLPVKPRWRGWLHFWAFVASFGTGAVLVSVAAFSGERAVVGTVIYAVTVSLLFGTSALYHRRTWNERGRRVMKRLDHSMIFVFIAGTYTPFALLVLPREFGEVILAVVWLGALGGVVLKQAWITAPRWLTVPPYLLLGWVAIFVLPAMLREAGLASLLLLVIGGLIYTFGAIVYATRRPDPAPSVFGYHEVFHLCTIVAALCHYAAVILAVYAVH